MMHYSDIHPSFRLNGIAYAHQSLGKHAAELSEKENFEKAIGAFLLEWLSTAATVVVDTSGSTGTPKAITLEKKHMLNSAIATGEFFNLKEGNTALLCLPAHYIAGKMMLVRAMVLGLQLDYVEPSATPLNEKEQAYDFCAMIPLQVHASLSKLNQLKKLIIGGAAVSLALKNELKKIATLIFETYGMTETITHIALKQLHSENQFFRTLPNVRLSVDARNCLEIHAPKVTSQKITTNDVVRLISESEFEWLGRYDTIINSGGIKINPEQIEAKLSTYIKAEFFVTSVPDLFLENKLILVVEATEPLPNLETKLKHTTVLSKYEIPKEIYFLPKFMRTETGKINRPLTVELLKK